MSRRGAFMNTRYDYHFENVKRSCGHSDDRVDVLNSILAYEPKVLEMEQSNVCFACQDAKLKSYRDRERIAVGYGVKYCQEHGIDTANVNIVSQNDGKQVEVILWLDV